MNRAGAGCPPVNEGVRGGKSVERESAMNIDLLGKTWNVWGEAAPYYAVLSNREDWEPEAFFRTGVEEIGRIMDLTGRYFPRMDRGQALDFG